MASVETPVIPASDPEAWVEQFTASLCAERDRAGEFLAAQQNRVEQAEAFVEQQLDRLEKELKAERDEAERLRIARDALTTRLAQTESRLAEAEKRMAESPHGGDHRAAEEELQQRYESAMDELRLARNKNAELQQQVARARSTAAKLAQQARKPGWLDWEAEKLRILAALEADGNQDDEAQQSERLGIVEVLRITDEVIAAKDREIQQLKKRLEEQSRDGAASAARRRLDRTDPQQRRRRPRRTWAAPTVARGVAGEAARGGSRAGAGTCEDRQATGRTGRTTPRGRGCFPGAARHNRHGPANKPSRRAGDGGWPGWG